MLEPVRNHFATNTRAKELLQLVQQYKKESLDPSEKTVRRLNLILLALGKVPMGSHLVFAPLPREEPSLQEAVDALTFLRLADGRPCVLFLSDWSARACNACDADVKAIAAYYDILVASLKALDASLMSNVQVVYQSEAILADPSNYWFSVISIGRHFMLYDVMGSSMKDSEGVGTVIARLMRLAVVAGVEPASVALPDSEASQIEELLVEQFFGSKLPGVSTPSTTRKNGMAIRLRPDPESEALKTDNDEYFLLDDPKVHDKAKMKKAFCEPGNISFCPPIAIASVFAFGPGGTGSLLVPRSAEHVGDRTYQTVAELENEFANGSLHPGDLKASITAVMVDFLTRIAQRLKSDAGKVAKDLKAYQKKASKSKIK